jgi:hypothetical protein
MSARIMQALMGRPRRGLQLAQSPSDRLLDRGYLDTVPPVSEQRSTMGGAQAKAFEAYLKPRIDALRAFGFPEADARLLAKEMPAAMDERRRLDAEGIADPQAQENLRRLLEDLR